MTEEERYAAKAAARRKSCRCTSRPGPPQAWPVTVDVLLLDPATEPVALQFLLEAFGFRGTARDRHRRRERSILEATPLAAAFIDVEVETTRASTAWACAT